MIHMDMQHFLVYIISEINKSLTEFCRTWGKSGFYSKGWTAD